MSRETTDTETVFTLRLSRHLNEKLIGEAKTESRSRQAQIVYLLNRHFETPHGSGKKEKAR